MRLLPFSSYSVTSFDCLFYSCRTYHGKIRYSADRLITLDEFFKDVPLFDKFPTDHLIEKVNSHTYCTSDRIRKLLRSAILPLYICKQLGMSIPGAFKAGNVGVLSGIDIFAFKELDIHDLPTVGDSDVSSSHGLTENNCYGQFVHFFKDLVCKYVFSEALAQLPAGFGRFLKDLKGVDTDDDNVVYNAVFWPKILMATMFFEFHRLLREEFPARGLTHKAMRILKAIDQDYPNFPDICAKNGYLISWAGVHGKISGLSGVDINAKMANRFQESAEDREFSAELLTALHSVVNSEKNVKVVEVLDGDDLAKGSKSFASKIHAWERRYMWLKGRQRIMEQKLLEAFQESGALNYLEMPSNGPKEIDDMKTPLNARVVDTHRHAVVHAIKSDNVDLADGLPEVNQQSLENEPYEVDDIVDLFTYEFPDYPTQCVNEFSKYCLWYTLQLRKRFPIPSIFCPNTEA